MSVSLIKNKVPARRACHPLSGVIKDKEDKKDKNIKKIKEDKGRAGVIKNKRR